MESRPMSSPDHLRGDCFLRHTLVLIPALDEEACIAETVREWLARGAAGVRVVDNGSSDATASVAMATGATVVHEPVRGYGAAAARGLHDVPTRFAWILFSSADGSDCLTEADVAAWNEAVTAGADLVLGDRTANAASRSCLTWSQQFGNSLCCALIALGWSRRFRDLGSLRLVKRHVLERMRLRDRGFGWNVEMQVRAVELGLRMVELPVDHRPRRAGRSKISGTLGGVVRAGFGILRSLAWLWRLRRTGQARRLGDLAAERAG